MAQIARVGQAVDEIIGDFVAEALEGIEALDSKLVSLERTPDDPALIADIFRLVHTIKGTSGFLGLGRLGAVAHAAENVLGGFRDGSLPVEPQAVTAVLDALDVIRALVHAVGAGGAEPVGDDGALIRRLDAIFEGEAGAPPPPTSRSMLERLGGEATLDAACEAVVADARLAVLFAGGDPDRLQAGLRHALTAAARQGGAPDLDAAVLGVTGRRPGAALALLMEAIANAMIGLEADAEAVSALLAPPSAAASTAPEAPPLPEAAAQTIRVNVDVLETLMTTVSELVLIRNQLIQTLRGQPESAFAGPLHRLNQVTSELQEGVMTTRMQPISGAWAKLPRLVRDLAADLGKRIDLTMTGQDTELDRQVLEMIKDPLTHMIRNAADHGIERPEVRRAAGKPEAGRITLSARHEGGAILIEMGDDGRGLNADAIRAKAVANRLITPAQADGMGDAEARLLIFLPGFSTADQVTAVSGRGVGMDVVRTNIEKIGGAIELSSVEGQGSRFTIRIPLTLSIVSALIVEAAGERFALPQSGIVELVSAGAGEGRRIERINGAAVLRLRDRLLPLVSLGGLLGLAETEAPRSDACIVVARVGGFSFGVVVDRVFDTEEIVVKPTASVLRHLKIYSGATILGDGSVIMILDIKGVSLEAGAAHLAAGTDEPVAATASLSAEPTETLLVFRAGDRLKVASLASVVRIEEVGGAAVEQADDRSVIQYRGGLMPVVDCGGAAVPSGEAPRRPLLVFARRDAAGRDQSLGVVADEILDIVEGPAPGEGAAGLNARGLIVAGRAAERIDIARLWRALDGEPVTAVPAAPAAHRAPDRRVLVVDESPFTELLLRPLLTQAGYAVEVASGAERALALHDAGERYDLILADTSPTSDATRRLVQTLARAHQWHQTPLVGLGAYRLSEADVPEAA